MIEGRFRLQKPSNQIQRDLVILTILNNFYPVDLQYIYSMLTSTQHIYSILTVTRPHIHNFDVVISTFNNKLRNLILKVIFMSRASSHDLSVTNNPPSLIAVLRK